MFTIGEFSQVTGLTVKTLRFYHEKGLLVPAAIDPATGYRTYDDRNVDRARVIVALRDLKFSLDDIAEILAGCAEDEDMLEFLERQKASLAARINQLSGAARQIDHLIQSQRRARKETAMPSQTFNIEERQLAPLLVAGIRMTGHYRDCGQGFAKLGQQLGRNIAGAPLCLQYDAEYRDGDANFEPCFPIRREIAVKGASVRTLPGGLCVTLIHRGPYEELGRSYERVLRHVKERGYRAALPTRETYLKGPGMIFRGNPKKYLTEIQVLVEEK